MLQNLDLQAWSENFEEVPICAKANISAPPKKSLNLAEIWGKKIAFSLI